MARRAAGGRPRRARPRRRAATAVLNRAPRTRRPSCSTSSRTRSTPGIYARSPRATTTTAASSSTVREPSASTDAPKLLEAGRAEFAILDIHDLGLARERGLDVVGVSAIVGRPAGGGDRRATATPSTSPADLEGGEVGVTGLPSDDAVLDSVLEAGGADPDAVRRVTIGFDAVAALAAGRLDAATAFWNAEGVALRDLGVPTREFRVDDYGAPPLPGADPRHLRRDAARGARARRVRWSTATEAGYRDVDRRPRGGARRPARRGPRARPRRAAPPARGADRRRRVRARRAASTARRSRAWARWDREHGILSSADRPRAGVPELAPRRLKRSAPRSSARRGGRWGAEGCWPRAHAR